MSKFSIQLSLKNIKILKHSLEQRIEKDKGLYELAKALGKETDIIKEHEEHLRCLDALIEQIERVGYRHGKNIFGEKYE